MASCPCCVFLSVHNREDIYYYWFVYLAGRAVYSGQFVCVCVAFTEYERPPMTKSPIWSRHAAILYFRLKLKQDAQVHLLYAFQFIYFPMQEGDWRRQPLISFSLKDSKRKKQLQGSSVKYGSCAVVSVEKSARVAEFVATISSETCVTARVAAMATCVIACSVNSLLHKEKQQE
ncbi:uncharacterized protein [Aegilops tauschii subsp. strangulata]|uniref:uncharacterized protein isoform X5 n=1 Tax=Aegilops tauschii subsp. strangulata TaxID=200361 RepID=UPI001E1CA995|nr:uncharacterized protein LOC109757865 isoform X17 [Aegilops tauschii subsp. strangulata]